MPSNRSYLWDKNYIYGSDAINPSLHNHFFGIAKEDIHVELPINQRISNTEARPRQCANFNGSIRNAPNACFSARLQSFLRLK